MSLDNFLDTTERLLALYRARRCGSVKMRVTSRLLGGERAYTVLVEGADSPIFNFRSSELSGLLIDCALPDVTRLRECLISTDAAQGFSDLWLGYSPIGDQKVLLEVRENISRRYKI